MVVTGRAGCGDVVVGDEVGMYVDERCPVGGGAPVSVMRNS
jgi:hypothetical protein